MINHQSSSPHHFSIHNTQFAFDPITLDLVAFDPSVSAKPLILTPPGIDPKLAVVRKPSPPGRIRRVTLEVTPDCHLRCRYCYLDDRSTGRGAGFLNVETATGFLKSAACGGSLPGISFFGGEPCLGWKRIEAIVDWAEAFHQSTGQPQPPQFHITTSGTLLTPARADYLAAHRFSIIVSIDGNERLHNANRKTLAGKPTFDRVMAGLELLKAAGCSKRITLRATYDGQLIDGGFQLAARAEFLNQLCDDGYASHASVEPAFIGDSAKTAICEKSVALSDGLIELLDSEYDELGDWFIGRERSGKQARFHQIEAPLRRLEKKQPSDSECGAGKGYVALGSDGRLHACHRQSHDLAVIGDAETGIDPARRAVWTDNLTTRRTDCASCPIRRVCGGGCRIDSLCETGDMMRSVGVFCRIKNACFRQSARILLTRAERDGEGNGGKRRMLK